MRSFCTLLLSILAFSPAPAVAEELCRVWQDRTYEVPFPRGYGEIVYDSWRDVIVYVMLKDTGWYGNPTYRMETWEWDRASWTLRLEPGPSPRSYFSLAFDQRRGVTVLFGGSVPRTDDRLGDTWEWDGKEWHLITDTGPAPRSGSGMAYDSANERIILAGGWQYGRTFQDFWAYDSSGWQPLIPELPAAGGTVAYDTSRSVVMLFAGGSPQLWEFDGFQWVERAANPTGIQCDSAVYDEERRKTLCLSGEGGTSEWDGLTWQNIELSRGLRDLLSESTMVPFFHKSRKAIVAYCWPRGVFAAGLWEIGAENEWRLIASTGPVPRRLHAMEYDAARDQTVLFGGYMYLWDTWTWDGTTWNLASLDGPSPRQRAAMAYDTIREVVVLFGGQGYEYPDVTANCCSLDGTYEWNGREWIEHNLPGPGKRQSAAMAYDEARGVTVLFGGYFQPETYPEPPAHYWTDTWTWDGLQWTELIASGPSAGHTVMAYDPTREVIVLFGAASTEDELGNTWEWNGSAWLKRDVAGPPFRYATSIFCDRARGRIVVTGIHNTDSGRFGEIWEWDGNDWRYAAQIPPIIDDAEIAYDKARDVAVFSGGYPYSGGTTNETWEYILGSQTADADSDCDVDLFDFAVLQTCMGDMSTDAACAQLDVDGSGWIDAVDFAQLFAMPTGPSEPSH